ISPPLGVIVVLSPPNIGSRSQVIPAKVSELYSGGFIRLIPFELKESIILSTLHLYFIFVEFMDFPNNPVVITRFSLSMVPYPFDRIPIFILCMSFDIRKKSGLK
ncbi:hypothetical protein PanWU01x14_227520, partial [Parasponia andersonii]